MDQQDEKRRGDPNMSGAASGASTPGNPSAAGDANPAVGAPTVSQPQAPPPVIHRAGDARPGESNPAAGMTAPDGRPAVDTAQFLAEREFAEEARVTPAPGGSPYADASGDVGHARDAQGGRVHAPEGAVEPEDYERAPHPYAPLGTAGAGDKAIDARVESHLNAYANEEQQAESLSGLDSERSGYERREVGQGQMNELRDDVALGAGAGMAPLPRPAGSVTAVFADVTSARAAVQALQDIGIRPHDISMLARGPGGVDEGVTETGPSTPAGGGSFRSTSDALPNDEDLPSTVAAQTGEPAAEAPAPGPPTLTESPRGGLAGGEGEIPRVESPADPDIYSDFTDSDADYRTEATEAAAQTGETDVADAGANTAADDPHVDAGHGAALGGAFGGLTGLLVGLGALAIPGLGPIIAAGPLVGALTGLLAGGATGGLVGALLDAGVPHDRAGALAERVAGGDVLLSVQTDQVTHAAVERVLRANGALEIH
jgi:hypothetical protein